MRKLETVVNYLLGLFMVLLMPLGLGLTIWALQDAIFQGASGQAAVCSAAVAAWGVILIREIKGVLEVRRARRELDAAFPVVDNFYLDEVRPYTPDEDEQA